MKTAQLLQLSQNNYELLIFAIWLEYCESKTYSPEQLQALAGNNPLFQWWLNSLRGLEDEFRIDAFPYRDTMSKSDAEKLYRKHTEKLKRYYSTPLIKRALTPEPQNKKQ
ncbi:MAG: hypothetical protein ABGW88_13855 [Leeuwenhoekiella sp.]|uniref:hypothetical protein n=1 Tax=Leeuwenhoekiella sp. TaxID=1977054 RepID=UPI003242B218